jgi:hypothetical protein
MNSVNPAHWPQDLINRINTFERKLADNKGHISANQNMKDEYFVALKKVAEAKNAISRLAGTFNKEYGQE